MEETDSDQRGGERGIMVEGRGKDKRACTSDPWTWTSVRTDCGSVGEGLGWAEEGKGRKIGTTVIE